MTLSLHQKYESSIIIYFLDTGLRRYDDENYTI